MAESLDAQVGKYLNEEGFPELVSEVLSGGTSSEKITEVMDRIEKFDLDHHYRAVLPGALRFPLHEESAQWW